MAAAGLRTGAPGACTACGALGLTAGTIDVWYGAGENRTRSSDGTVTAPGAWSSPSVYAHLGARQGTQFGQWDIKQHGIYDNARGLGAISFATATLPDTGNGFILNASDIAAELWIPSRRRHSLRIRPYLTGDNSATPGVTSVMSSAEVVTYVLWANNVYGGSNIEFLYNRTVPAGTGGQLSTVFNTLINNGGYDTGDAGWLQAQFRAERFPADISVFFPHGPTPNVETVGGASNPAWSFVQAQPLGTSRCTGTQDDVTHLAHELGHYLNIWHTFAGNPQNGDELYETTAEAQKVYNDKGCDGSIFDGDDLDDTNYDPFVLDMECSTNVPVLYLYCNKTATWDAFYLPKDNIMDYANTTNWPWDKTLTTKQMEAMEQTMLTRATRKRLE